MAFFCPTCPQPRVNLPDNWRSLLSSTDSCQNPGNSWNSRGINFGTEVCQIDYTIPVECRTEFQFCWNGSRNHTEGMAPQNDRNRIIDNPSLLSFPTTTITTIDDAHHSCLTVPSPPSSHHHHHQPPSSTSITPNPPQQQQHGNATSPSQQVPATTM